MDDQKKPRLSPVLKGLMIGAAIGAITTVLMVLPIMLNDSSSENALPQTLLASVALWPAWVFGLSVDTTVGHYSMESWFLPTLVAAVVNSFLCSLVGMLIGSAFRQNKPSR